MCFSSNIGFKILLPKYLYIWPMFFNFFTCLNHHLKIVASCPVRRISYFMFSLLLQSVFKIFSLIYPKYKIRQPICAHLLVHLYHILNYNIHPNINKRKKKRKKELIVEGIILCWYFPLHTILPTFLYIHRVIVLMIYLI